MINAFELYCILKLDDICTTLVVLAFVTGVVFLPTLIIAYANEIESKKLESLSKNILFFFTVPAMLISSLCPTTKQAAAMIVIPKIATQENIEYLNQESKELYSIAKEAIMDFVENNKK